MYIENFLYPHLCGYRKIFKMLALIENWKKVPDNKDFEGAVLMDLSKPFDMINHDLLISKLQAYGFSNDSPMSFIVT